MYTHMYTTSSVEGFSTKSIYSTCGKEGAMILYKKQKGGGYGAGGWGAVKGRLYMTFSSKIKDLIMFSYGKNILINKKSISEIK